MVIDDDVKVIQDKEFDNTFIKFNAAIINETFIQILGV